MRLTSSEASHLLDLLDPEKLSDERLDEVRSLLKPHVFTSHTPKVNDKIQYRSPKVTGWSDEALVLSVLKDGDGDDVMVLSITENDGTKKVTQKYVNSVQIRPAQPRRQRKVNETSAPEGDESQTGTPEGDGERIVPSKGAKANAA